MTLVQRHHPAPDHHFVRRAWIASALVPVGLALAAVLAFAGGEHGEGANRLAGAGLAMVALAAPTAAMYMAVLAERAGERSAGAALAVSMILGVLVLLALPLAVVSGQAVLVAAGVCLIGVIAALHFRGRIVHE
jgi:hypothetical protein